MGDVNRKINIYINGKQVEDTMTSLKKAIRHSRNELGRMTYGTQEYIAQVKKIKSLQKFLESHKKAQGQITSGWKKMVREFKTMAGAVAVGNMFANMIQRAANWIPNLVQGSASLSDELADIAKTTGLASEEVEYINSQFKYFDTRTPRSELRKLAAMAGKLGKNSVRDVLDFVETADKIKVALGDDLGGDEAIRKLGKINELFKVEARFGTESAFLKTGSAINSLGAASVANEEFLVNFTKRFGGIAKDAEIAIEDVLGLAATFDILGKSEEIASTATSKLLIEIGKDIPKYAKVAKMETAEFAKLLREDANDALIKVLEGAKSTAGGLKGLSTMLGTLGINSAQSAQVIPALGANLELLKKQQELAKEEFDSGNSVLDEFSKKNNNLAANLQKVGVWFNKLFFNSKVTNALNSIVGGFADWVKIPLSEKLQNEKTEVNLLVNSIVSLNDNAQTRLQLINELQKKYPDFIGNVDAEKVTNQKLLTTLKKVNDEYLTRIKMAVVEDEIEKVSEKQIGNERELRELTKQINKDYAEIVKNKKEGLSLDKKLEEIGKSEFSIVIDGMYMTKDYYLRKEKYANKYNELLNKRKSLIEEMNQLIGEKGEIEKELPEDEPKPGQEKLIDGKVHIFKNGKWELKKIAPAGDGSGGPNNEKDLLEKRKNALNQYESTYRQYAKNIQSIRHQLSIQGMDEHEKELANLKYKYDEQKKVVNDAIAYFQNLKGRSAEEEQALNNFYTQKIQIENNYQNEINRVNEKYDKERLEKKKEVEEQIKYILSNGKDQQKIELVKKYQALIEEAKKYGVDTKELYQKLADELKQIDSETTNENKLPFGFTEEQWDSLHEKIQVAGELLNNLSSLRANLNRIESYEEERKLQAYEKQNKSKQDILKKQLDAGFISEKAYNMRVEELENDLERKRARIARAQAERERETKIFQARINEAMGIINIWSTYAANPILAGILTAGLLAVTESNIAAIKKEPLPEIPAYGEGGEINSPQLILAGEKGREIVFSNKMLKGPFGPVLENLAMVQAGKKPNFTGMSNAISGQNSVTNNYVTENNTEQPMDPPEWFREYLEEIKLTNSYLKDPKNRQAFIPHETLKQYDEDNEIMDRFTNL